MRFIFLIAIFMSSFAFSVRAEAPTPNLHPTEEIEQKLKQKKAKQKALEKKAKSLKSDASKKKKDMVYIASRIKKNEKTLLGLENEILEIEKKKIILDQKITKDKEAFSQLVLALHKSQSMPKAVLYLQPQDSLKMAQTSMLLETTLKPLQTRAKAFQEDVQKLNNITKSLKEKRAKAIASAKELEENHKRLAKVLADNQKLYALTNKQSAIEKRALAKIAKEAKSLRELVNKIEKQENTRTTQKASYTRRTPIPKAGKAQLPASGVITTSYGFKDEIDAKSEGIHIQTRSGAIVVAPMGGVIDYAGSFKGYGKIIIIKHEKNYHSLIAGLEKIDTAVGRAVTAGEPIGKTPKKSNEEQDLYYELRYKGNPVNPSRKISGL